MVWWLGRGWFTIHEKNNHLYCFPLAACSIHSLVRWFITNQIRLRLPVCLCFVGCDNVYSISSHPTWHKCASSSPMWCRATGVQWNLRIRKSTSHSPFSCVLVYFRRLYLPFHNVNLQRFTAEITLHCVPSVCRSLISVRLWQYACRHSSWEAAWPMAS